MSPRAVYYFVLQVLDAAVFPMIRFHLDDLPNDRLRVQQEVLPGFRESLAFQYGTLGAMLAVPGYIGLPESRLESVTITPRVLLMTVKLPSSRTAFARVRRLVPRLFPRQALHEMRDDKIELAKTFAELRASEEALVGRTSALAKEKERREQLEGALKRALAAIPGEAFLISSDTVAPANAAAERAIEREGETLRSAVRDAAERTGMTSDFETTLIDDGGRRLLVRNRNTSELAKRLESAAVRWGLTPRQTDVLRGLLDGLGNAEIAERLGCASERSKRT